MKTFCKLCKKDISHYKVYERYQIDEDILCFDCWKEYMEEQPLEMPVFGSNLLNNN